MISDLQAFASSGILLLMLLATSAVLTMVLGLALQDTLANLIARSVFHFENSIRISDWLEFDRVTASVREFTGLEVLVIPKDGFETILKKNKEFISKIESIVEERLETYPEFSDLEKTAKPKFSLIKQIRSYLLGSGQKS